MDNKSSIKESGSVDLDIELPTMNRYDLELKLLKNNQQHIEHHLKDLEDRVDNLSSCLINLENSNKELQDSIDDFLDTYTETTTAATVIGAIFSSVVVCMIIVAHFLN